MNITILLAALLVAGAARAADGLAFLKIDADAASAARGECAAGGWSTAMGGLRNPALAPADGRWHVALTQADWIFDSDYSALALQVPLGAIGLGLDLRSLAIEDIELRDGPDPDPLGSYRVDDLAFGLRLSAPLPLMPGLRAGVAARRVQEKIDQQDSKGWVFDAGLRWEQADPERSRLWGVSVAARNLGSGSEFITEGPEAPRLISLGVERQLPLPLVGWTGGVQAEWRHLREDGGHLHLGLQVNPAAGLALRGGWMGGYDERGPTLGAGFAWRGLVLDYAWLPFDSALDDVHRFTLGFAM
jgi:hypothetical protein